MRFIVHCGSVAAHLKKSIRINSVAPRWSGFDITVASHREQWVISRKTDNIATAQQNTTKARKMYWDILFNDNSDNGITHSDVIMSVMTSQITGVSIVYSTVCSGADQRKHQSSASLVFVRGIFRWPVNTPHKGQYCGKCFRLMK